MTYDPKCLELAQHFLPGVRDATATQGLAHWIQDEVGSWIEGQRTWRAEAKAERGCCRTGPGCDWPDCPCANAAPAGTET